MNAIIAISGTKIRHDNGLYSLNDLHMASGGQAKHKPANWLRSQQTVDIIEQIEIAQKRAIQSKQRLGTFVCKELVIHYGMWISPEFSLKVIRTFLDVTEKPEPKISEMQQTIKQAGCLVELARRMRYTTGDCSKDRLDKPIEELAPVFIV